MGEAFPDNEELKAIKDYFIREKQGETDYISLQDSEKKSLNIDTQTAWFKSIANPEIT